MATRAPPLSKRSERLVISTAEYKKAYGATFGPAGYSHDNPDGIIALCVAENYLSADMVCARLAKVPSMPESALHYGGYGSEKVAQFLAKYVSKRPVDRGQVVLTSGASGAIDNLMHTLCEAGDAVLTPAPGYNGFEDSTFKRANVQLLSAQLQPEDNFQLTVDVLQRAWEKHGGEASSIRCILISNPSNPCGQVLSADEIRQIVSFARSRGLYTIFDEVYGGASVHAEDVQFVSAAEALDNDLGDDVCTLWAISKDFCACGLRVGAVVTQRKELWRRLAKLQLFGAIGRYNGWAIGDMLNDDSFLVGYVAENRRRLAAAYAHITRLLERDGVPYCSAKAGFFLLIDLRAYLDAPASTESEMRLFHRLVDQARVVLTPSSEMFGESYGWFRLCYGSVRDTELLEVAWNRVRDMLMSQRGR